MNAWIRRGLMVLLFFLVTLSFDALALLLPNPSTAASLDGQEVLWLQRTLPPFPFDHVCLVFYLAGYPFLLFATAWTLAPERHLFLRYVLVFTVCQSLALLIWSVYPVAPPRMTVGGIRWVRGELLLLSERFNTFPYGAFPSMHAAHGLVSLLFILGKKKYRGWWALILAGMVFSSIYLGEHYVVDVFGGFALGTMGFWLVTAVARIFGRIRPISIPLTNDD